MKVTAILPDTLIVETQHYSGGKNITESLMIALTEWLALKHIQGLNKKIEKQPLDFKLKFSAENLREINRR